MTKANAAQLPRADRFTAFTTAWAPRIESALDALLPREDEAPAELHRAMRHAMFPGGKRLRPLCALVAAEVSGGDPARALVAASSLELVHTYSLVHDDLPCMDDDALRRGRPTCHVAFGEATALLAGDALLTLAFGAVASAGPDAVSSLALAAGSRGMVGGQVGDLAAEDRPGAVTLDELQWIHDRKTGALITASFEVGLFAGGGRREALEPLRRYGRALGRAFQVVDDILDVTSTAAELGKAAQKDAARGKATYPGLLGLVESRRIAEALATEAVALAPVICAAAGGAGVDSRRGLLEDLAQRCVARKT
ncbi:MAG: polyprenyl synthetase family protein [Planctomycetes bacterium]|nr:polyprenyl synthetase family protein [Planctomycetota bacterium]